MSFHAQTGPFVAFGRGRSAGGTGQSTEYNPNSPSPGFIGEYMQALMDSRQPFTYQPGQSETAPFYGYLGGTCTLIDQAPAAISTTNIAASQHMTASTALTLVSSSGGGITVGTAITNANTGASVAGLLAIDTAMAGLGQGAAASFNLWDPAKAISRVVSLTSAANISAINFTVRGYDLYGFPLTQTLAGPNANTVNTTKAFKYVASVTPDTTDGTNNVSIGVGDVFGLPLRADAFGYLTIFWNNALITASTGFTAAVTTSPATASTGDVRGTYAVQSASDGTKALQVFWRPKAANISQTGFWGVAQV